MASNSKAAATVPVKKNAADPVPRGKYGKDPASTATFLGLRTLDLGLQYGILGKGLGSSLLNKLGLATLSAGPPNTETFLDRTGLSPYRLILLAMATGSTVKHIVWYTLIANEEYSVETSATISLHSSIANSINTLAFTTAVASASLSSGSRFPQTPLLVGSALYIAGMAIELVSEVQRKQFKDSAAGKGKLYTGGLWQLSRHINYFGFTLWRTGFAIAAGGWTLGALIGGLISLSFVKRPIPWLEEYTANKYGAEWQEYERKTPYVFIPFVF